VRMRGGGVAEQTLDPYGTAHRAHRAVAHKFHLIMGTRPQAGDTFIRATRHGIPDTIKIGNATRSDWGRSPELYGDEFIGAE